MVLSIAQGFGMNALVHDPYVEAANIEAAGARPATLDEVIAGSDVLSLHLPLTAQTTRLINADTLAAMKPGAVLINTSRGGLVDETALVAALAGGHLAAAGLDVVQGESVDMKNPLPHSDLPIATLPNLIVTPHVGGQSAEAFLAAGTGALAAIRQVLAGERPSHAVNTIAVPAYR
jgi:D-3-phosphoglycerate dehydrogenase